MGIRQSIKRLPAWVKIVAGAFLFLLLAGTIGVSIYVNKLVNNKLRESVYESSSGLYKLDYSNISLNVFSGNMTIHKARLIPDTTVYEQLKHQRKAPRFLVEGQTEKLIIKNVRWLRFLNTKKLKIGRLIIERPEFRITQYRLKKDTARRSSNVYDLISKHAKDLRIGTFKIADAAIHYQVADTVASMRTINKIEHLNLEFLKIHFAGEESNRHLAADEYFIRLQEYRYRTSDSMYWIGLNGFDYNSRSKKTGLSAFYVEPVHSEKDFSKKIKEQKSLYRAKLEDISGEGFDLSTFVEEGEAIFNRIRVGKGSVNIYMDRSLPAPSKDKSNVVLSQKLMKLDLPFTIKTVDLNKIELKYRESNPVTGQTALIAFQDVAGKASNITTMPAFINQNAQMHLSATARFLNASVKAEFAFDLRSSNGNFTSKVRANQIEAEKLNPILVPIAKIEIRKGILEQLEADVYGNEDQAVANVKLVYEGLKINVLKLEGDSLTKKGFKTMFANLFIKDDNPEDGVLRTADKVVRQRRFGKSFFNMLWSSISGGIQQIITGKKDLKF